jgi:hypothetical protein
MIYTRQVYNNAEVQILFVLFGKMEKESKQTKREEKPV